MLNANEHDKLLDLWEIFVEHRPVTVPQQNLYRDLEIALGLVRDCLVKKERREAIERCLKAWENWDAAVGMCPCSYHAAQRTNSENEK